MKDKTLGRPEKEFIWGTLDAALQYGGSLIDCSELMGVSEDTIQRRIKSSFGMTFTKYKNLKMSRIRMKLRQKQFDEAMNGNTTLLIWLGKNMLGQTDKSEINQTSEIKITIDKDDAEL